MLGRLAIERYLGRALAKLPYGAGSSLLHVVGGDMGGGYEWQAAPNYCASVRRGTSAVTLDQDGKVIRWIDYWDGRHFGAELAAKMRTPADKFPTNFKESTSDG